VSFLVRACQYACPYPSLPPPPPLRVPCVPQTDNRGSYHRGHAFERVVFRNLGVLEVEDQVSLVRCVQAMGLGAPEAVHGVGAFGWSYGG
jgi:dipeptidyl aminopeptidase/acylaminoacyl peptidase